MRTKIRFSVAALMFAGAALLSASVVEEECNDIWDAGNVKCGDCLGPYQVGHDDWEAQVWGELCKWTSGQGAFWDDGEDFYAQGSENDPSLCDEAAQDCEENWLD